MTNAITTSDNPLGKATGYSGKYDPSLLFAIDRLEQRKTLGLTDSLPFGGSDIWNAYELSWLNDNGKPQVAVGRIELPCDSPKMVESKSLKLYLNSFNETRFPTAHKVRETIIDDLSDAAGAEVKVELLDVEDQQGGFTELPGICIDGLDVNIDDYHYAPELLQANPDLLVEEVLYSHLLKSNCLITNQPDWASIMVRYQGPAIERETLLKYLISFRTHNEFHEHCVERIFADIKHRCQPKALTVYARYTRRGGLDINPWRSDFESGMPNWRLVRQ